MYPVDGKKASIIYILEILKAYSDYEHRLSAKEIMETLEREYSMKLDRSAVKDNLNLLVELGYNIEFTETKKIVNGEERSVCTDWYYEHDFSDAELRLLIDNLLMLKRIPYNQCKDLIEKIKKLSSKHFFVNTQLGSVPENKQLFYTIGILDEAIEKNRKVEFSHGRYNHKKEFVLDKTAEGEVKRTVFSPYKTIANNGRYYLIGNYEGHDNVAYVRIDRISEIEILDGKAKPKKEVKGLEHGLNLPKTMAEQIYMMHGEAVSVKFRAKKEISEHVVDWFGFDFVLLDETDEDFTVSVKVNPRAMRFWALQYGNFVEVLEPKDLREKIKDSLWVMNQNYSD